MKKRVLQEEEKAKIREALIELLEHDITRVSFLVRLYEFIERKMNERSQNKN